MIPKKIHQIWIDNPSLATHFSFNFKNERVPLEDLTKSWKDLNPEYEYKLHNDEEIIAYIAKYFPIFVPYLKNLKPIEVIDLARYVILYIEGGIYADVDTYCMRPMDELFADKPGKFYTCLEDLLIKKWQSLPPSPSFAQWFIACEPKHPIIAKIIWKILAHAVAHNPNIETEVFERTGPGIWSKTILENLECDGLQIGPPDWFAPEQFYSIGPCGQKNYVIHLFAGTWKRERDEEYIKKIKAESPPFEWPAKLQEILTNNGLPFTVSAK